MNATRTPTHADLAAENARLLRAIKSAMSHLRPSGNTRERRARWILDDAIAGRETKDLLPKKENR